MIAIRFCWLTILAALLAPSQGVGLVAALSFESECVYGLLPKRYPFERPLKAFCFINQGAAKEQ
jgi:hypothetical protein